MAKVYLFLADGFEEVEAFTVVDLLRRAGIEMIMVSITNSKTVTGSHQITTIADALFDEVDYSDSDMLILPGGMPGTRNLSEHVALGNLLSLFHQEKKPLAAICAAPSVLGTKGLLKGKKATCYPGFEEKLDGADIKNLSVVVDGNLITSKGLGTAIDFSLAIIEFFKGVEEANKIKDAIQYRN